MTYLIVYLGVLIVWAFVVGFLYRKRKIDLFDSEAFLVFGVFWPSTVPLTILFFIGYTAVEIIRTIVASVVWATLGKFPEWELWEVFKGDA